MLAALLPLIMLAALLPRKAWLHCNVGGFASAHVVVIVAPSMCVCTRACACEEASVVVVLLKLRLQTHLGVFAMKRGFKTSLAAADAADGFFVKARAKAKANEEKAKVKEESEDELPEPASPQTWRQFGPLRSAKSESSSWPDEARTR